jgi:hypothetical protein
MKKTLLFLCANIYALPLMLAQYRNDKSGIHEDGIDFENLPSAEQLPLLAVLAIVGWLITRALYKQSQESMSSIYPVLYWITGLGAFMATAPVVLYGYMLFVIAWGWVVSALPFIGIAYLIFRPKDK